MRSDEVVEWDEYLQGYDAQGRLVVCVCGIKLTQPGYLEPNGKPHCCPYDEPFEEAWANGRVR